MNEEKHRSDTRIGLRTFSPFLKNQAQLDNPSKMPQHQNQGPESGKVSPKMTVPM